MTDTNEMIERLRRRGRLFPASGGGTITAEGMVTSYVTDDGFRYINPDGPEAADRLASQQSELSTLRQQAEAMAEALEPLAVLQIPTKSVGNAGAYSIRHRDIFRADQALQSYRSQNND